MNSIQQTQEKWKGKAKTELLGCKANQVWPLLEDFFGLGKWFPTLSTCIPLEGISGKPGCVRFCGGFKTPVDEHDKQTLNWTKQKLLSIDPIQRVFTYSIIDGNVGFHNYVSTVKVLEKDDGCVIEWLYEVEPVEGWKLEYLDLFIGSGLDEMGQRIQGALKIMENALVGV
ncbi:lachrymatory-factor synthase-like [Trifolium pratense]|uniref:lachrymatory-factor synthase-like n=1 Tax=Trifolium pratense TaxID=57577 RepID=UPI001E6966BD|nr:lachrymatory-factor synthase-like [Trifolium pratense]